ncbi:MAG: tetratricopeptide repeat protein [Candidatus Auribacterota bacterium]|jgi:tetratricopeptide (TPR) repeat protein|nr:tetratricopeptide repeat protein [Candidatus Auribacterota bacterium]
MNITKRIVYLLIPTILVWGHIVAVPFLWDDEGIILLNSFTGSIKSLRFLFNQDYFAVFGELSYRPLTTLSHILDSVIWGKNPVAHHLVNLLLHIATVILVYNMLGQLLCRNALLATILFAVHPVHLETLGVVAYRDDILMTLFLTASVLCYIRMRKSGGLFAGMGMLLCFTASVCAKETGLIFLPLILIYETMFCTDKHRTSKTYFFIAMIFAVCCIYILYRFIFLAHPQESMRALGFTASIPAYLRPVYVVMLAVRLCVLPAPIIIEFSSKPTIYPLLIQGAIMFCIGLYIFRGKWHRKDAQYACAMTFIPIVAVMHIYPLENFFAGRFMYLPAIGFCWLITLTADFAIPLKKAKALLALMLVVFYSCMSLGGLYHFFTPTAFAEKLIFDSPDCYKAYNYLGTIGLNNEDMESAEQFFEQALNINPLYYEALFNLVSLYLRNNNFDNTEPLIERLIALNPIRSEGYALMGDLWFNKDNLEKAEFYYNKALTANSFDLDVRNNLGILYETQGNLDLAADMYLSILKINSSFALAWANLGNINIARKEYDLARTSYLNALNIEPYNAKTWYNLGNAYFYQQKWGNAKSCYIQSIQLDMAFADPLYNLAVINVYQKQFDDATVVLSRYIQLRPEDIEAQKMLNFLLNR